MKNNCKEMLKNLKKELYPNKEKDFILKLFEKRRFEIDSQVIKNEKYKKYSKEIKEVYDRLENKYKDDLKIITSFEEYSDAIYSRESVCNKLLYKYGVMDGMRLIIDGMTEIKAKNI